MICTISSYFNPLPPHGGRRIHIHTVRRRNTFQSTPSAWRETCRSASSLIARRKFQSTPSAWRETSGTVPADDLRQHFNPLPPHGGRHADACQFGKWAHSISIHSLRMEGDHTHPGSESAPGYFNPLPPHGGRQQAFQSNSGSYDISIHSLRMEGDPSMLVIYNR